MANRWPHTILVADLGNRIFTQAVSAGAAAALPAPAFELACAVSTLSDDSNQLSYDAHGGTFLYANRNIIRFEVATSRSNYVGLILGMSQLRQQNLDNGYVRIADKIPFVLTSGLPNIIGIQPEYLYLQIQSDTQAPNNPFAGYNIANLSQSRLLDPTSEVENRLSMTFETVRIRPDRVTINTRALLTGT